VGLGRVTAELVSVGRLHKQKHDEMGERKNGHFVTFKERSYQKTMVNGLRFWWLYCGIPKNRVPRKKHQAEDVIHLG